MRSKSLAGAIAGVVVGGSLIATIIVSGNEPTHYSYSKIKLLDKLLQHSYLREIDKKQVEDSIYAGFVSGLDDPLTGYLNEDQLKEQQVLKEGKYMGTGLKFEWGIGGRYIIITDIIPNSPASEANIKVGDKIVKIDGIKVMLSNESDLYKKLIYKGSEAVSYTIQDNDDKNERTVNLSSKIIDIRNITSKLIDKNIGWITLFAVQEGTSEALGEHIKTLKAEGAKQYIIDIRNLYSNNIEEISKICQLFINEKVAFKIKNKQGEMKEYKTAAAPYDMPLVLLINKGTKGAAEAFASAIKENKRGQLVGEKSAGVGRISEIIPLEDKTGLMITTGIIYSAKDKSLKDNAIMPDVPVKYGVDAIIELISKGKLNDNHDVQLMEAVKLFH